MNKEEKPMIEKKSWNEFRNTGLFWYVNVILHAFGWVLVVELSDDGNVTDCYPARCKFRGFSEDTNTHGYGKVGRYIAENGLDLLKDLQDFDGN